MLSFFFQRRYLIFFFGTAILCFVSSSVFCTSQKAGLSITGVTKYPENFTHFEYTSPNAQKGGALKMATSGTFDSLNFFIITGIPGYGYELLFSTLMKKSADEIYSIYPYAAESYEFSPDHLSIIYILRKEATFHDGTPITPEDVIFSFNILLHKGNPIYKAFFEDITKVEKVGERGIKFTFSTPKNHELPFIIGTNLPLLSQEFYKKYDFKNPSLVPPLGSGPYTYGDIEPGRSITLNRVKNWWGEKLPINRYQYNFDTVKVEYFRENDLAFEAFKKEELDLRYESSVENWERGYDFTAFKKGWVKRLEFPHNIPLGMKGFAINTRKKILKDIRVRIALFYAFDFEWINKNFFYNSYKCHTSYFFNSPFASSGLPSQEEYKILAPFKDRLTDTLFKEPFVLPNMDDSDNRRRNLIKAQALLKEAGWEVHNNQLYHHKTKEPFTLEIISQFPITEKVSLHFIKNLELLGIKAKFRLLDSAQYTERKNSFDYDILAGVTIPQINHLGNEQYDNWSSESANIPGSFNFCGISDPVVDALLDDIVNAPNFEMMIEYAHALDRVLLWRFYIIPNWSLGKIRIAYWNKFKFPDKHALYDPNIYTWWIDTELEKNLTHSHSGQ